LLYQKKPYVFLGKNGTGSKSTSQIKYHQLEKENISEYSCIQKDGTVIKVGSEYIWIWWVATIEP
jgi:hypothetical protein